MLAAISLVALLLVATGGASPPQSVSVVYAGSLVTVMEGPVAQALSHRGILFEGEGRGSRELANLVLAGLRTPDVVIVVDPAILATLQHAGLVAQSWPLGSAALGVAWAPASRDAALFDRAERGRATIARVLQTLAATGSARIARTDPRLDPKGRYTIDALRVLLGPASERVLLGADENPAQIFPEQDLLVRLESGEVDFGFIYSTEKRNDLEFVPLPGRASMSHEIRYVIATMKDAPHPRAARAFVDFLLHGQGRTLLLRAGLYP
ncbi:MAG: substrate-binding domain-containing protein [Candidatus Tyrphobacter sp.]